MLNDVQTRRHPVVDGIERDLEDARIADRQRIGQRVKLARIGHRQSVQRAAV